MSILSLSFNSDTTLLTCGTTDGYINYKLTPTIQKHSYIEKNGGVGIAKTLHNTNLSILVGGGEQPFKEKNKVVLWDDAKKKNALEIDLKDDIKNVLIALDKIIVVLEKKICIFNFSGYLLHSKDTYCNEMGICCINTENNDITIATIGLKKGEVAIWKLKNDDYQTIEAHANNIVSVALKPDNSMVATASDSGTNVHVYSTETGELTYKFKRGTFSSTIYGLTFSYTTPYLVCCSDGGTAHIFELSTTEESSKNTSTILSVLSPYVSTTTSTALLNFVKGYKTIRLDNSSKMVCSIDKNGVIHIATYDGDYFRIAGKEFDHIEKNKLHTNNK